MSIKPFIVPFTYRNYAGQSSSIQPIGSPMDWVGDDHGNRWRLIIFQDDTPGDDGEPTDPMVEVTLENDNSHFSEGGVGDEDLQAYYSFILRDARGRVYAEPDWRRPRNIHQGSMSQFFWPTLRRSELLNPENNILRDGSLLIDVHIQLRRNLHEIGAIDPVKPPPTVLNKMLQLLEDEEDKDVSFKVGEDIVTAHRLILKKDPSILFSICEENGDNGSPISIDDTTPEIFCMLLRYIYGEDVPPIFRGRNAEEVIQFIRNPPNVEEASEKAKQIIDAANRFGVVGLKMAVESALAETMVITSKNVTDWLIFSDAKTCALLKEQATAFFISRSEDLLNSDASNQLRESPRLLTELMMEIARSANPRQLDDESRMSVRELREELLQKGLDVDGDKETLVTRFRDSNREQQMGETE